MLDVKIHADSEAVLLGLGFEPADATLNLFSADSDGGPALNSARSTLKSVRLAVPAPAELLPELTVEEPIVDRLADVLHLNVP